MNLNNVKDLAQVVKSCNQLRSLFEQLISTQDQFAMRLHPETQRAWASASKSFLTHLADHHGWQPKSQVDVDALMRSVEDVAQELGL